MRKNELLQIISTAEKEKRALTEDEKRLLDEALKAAEETKDTKTEADEKEEQTEDETETKEETETDTEEQTEQTEAEEQTKKENKEEKNTKRNMNTNFSVLRSIRAIANGQPLSEVDAAVIAEGRKQNRNFECNGQIQMPYDVRSAVTVTVEGEDLVATEVWDIMKPLRSKNVLADAGAKFYAGLVGDVKVPVMSKSAVNWEGETDTAANGEPAFTHVTLSPKRLSAVVEISKQLIAQDSVDVENTIREDLINAVKAKLEETVLGDGSGSTTEPAGLFSVLSADTISDFADIVDKEADVEDANVQGECVYVMGNKAKAAMRSMIKGTNGTGMVFENGEVDGTKAFATSNVEGKKYIYGDFSNLLIGQWSGLDITVDPFSLSHEGKIRLVVNMYLDAKVARPEAFAAGELA